MGACYFENYKEAPTAKEAFDSLVATAQYMYGHGGYTGTIAEKSSFIMIRDTPESVVQRIKDKLQEPETRLNAGRAQLLLDRLQADDRGAIADTLCELGDSRVEDKWGPACCIELSPGKWLFFGYASS